MSTDFFFMSQADEKADKNPLIVMVDESTGEKYARAVGKKGIGEENEMEWLVKDMSEEMKSWGHQGGDGGHIILKSDGERSIVALRTALAKFHGGKVVPEDPPRGESQSNGTPARPSEVCPGAEGARAGQGGGRTRRTGRDRALGGALGGDDGVEVFGWEGRAHGVREETWQEMQDPGRGVRREGVVQGDQAGQGACQQVGERVARGAFGWDHRDV